MDDVVAQVKAQWEDLRGRTYDFLDVITPEDLIKKLPFPDSQSLYYQLDCMLGTTETFTDFIRTGEWERWHCSLPNHVESVPIEQIREHMKQSDEQLLKIFDQETLLIKQQDTTSPLQKYMRLVEHEAHHQGQLINFIYALNLPIPYSWEETWELTR